MSVITVENLRYQYPHAEKLALDGITFSVERGELSGKTEPERARSVRH